MKAIQTKYLGPTNSRGSRIKAFDEDNNQVTIPYPYALSGEDVHRKAADALMFKMGWEDNCEIIGSGSIKNGYVFTLAFK